MLDVSLIANVPLSNVRQFFGGSVTGAAGNWGVWTKPRGCTMAYILAVAAGGGGGGGGGVSQVTPGGGSGGGGGGIALTIIPLWFLPDRLYIQTGLGGAGGATDTNGTAGNPTYVCVQQSVGTGDTVCKANGGGGGNKGVTSAGGAAIGGGAAATLAQNVIGCAGISLFYGGIVSIAGGTAAGGGRSIAQPLGIGAPGGGGTGAGGDVTGSGQFPTISGGASSVVGNGSDGNSGIVLLPPYFALGALPGSGGGGSTAGNGGNGGNGAMTCGGAGGGGSTTANGGTGGRGGDGYAAIICW